MVKLIRSAIPLFVLFTSLLLISCAGTPDKNPVVKDVQDDYRKILHNSLVVENAPQELRKAREAVADVRRAVAGSESQEIVHRGNWKHY